MHLQKIRIFSFITMTIIITKKTDTSSLTASNTQPVLKCLKLSLNLVFKRNQGS